MAAFSDAWLRARNMKPYSGKPEITYRDGLGVRISPKGRISWIYRFLLNGNPVKMKIGNYPELKIKEAELLKDNKADLVFRGEDPRSQALQQLNDGKKTLTALIDEWVEIYAKSNISQWHSALSLLRRYVVPSLGTYKVEIIKIRDYMTLLTSIKSESLPIAISVLQRLKQVLSYGVKFGYLENNVLIVLTARDLGHVSHIRRVKQVDSGIGAHYSLISEVETNESYRNFLRLMTIFACRSVELRLSKKTDFDFHNLIWTVPEEHNKARKAGGGEIIRAIPDFAVLVLKEQFSISDGIYLFSAVRCNSNPLPAPSVQLIGRKHGAVLSKHGFVNTRNHDVRRTARAAWERMQFPYRVAETMLGHKVHTGVQEHYNDYQYIDEQRESYKRWCDYIEAEVEKYEQENG